MGSGGGAVLLGLFLLWLLSDVPIKDITRNPLTIVETNLLELGCDPEVSLADYQAIEIPFYLGALSNLGVILWAASGSICLFVGFSMKRALAKDHRRVLLGLGGLSFLLLMDDFFLLHERAFPQVFRLSEIYLFAVYGMLTLAFFATNWRTLLETDYLLLLGALAAFAVSLAVDHSPIDIPQPHFFEDGAKFLGILAWTFYCVRTSAALRTT